MRVGAVVQARMSSSRLPGKVLRPLAGRPMLSYLLEKLLRLTCLDAVAVATSEEPDDRPVAEFTEQQGVHLWRGPLNDVAARFLGASRSLDLDGFVRISGDSPLLDCSLVDRAVEMFRTEPCDLITNTLVRTYPKGHSVEVVRTSTYLNAYPDMAADELEHVTTHFYRNQNRFKIRDFRCSRNLGHINMSIDTAADFNRAQALLEKMRRPHWEYGYVELLTLLGDQES